MQAAILKDKLSAISGLEAGLASGCADDILEVLVNLEDNTCDYAELIPLLEKVAERDLFYYFDDNGAGGFPRPDLRRKPKSFKSWALRAIENIRENARFEADGAEAQALKSNDARLVKIVLENLAAGSGADKKLIPILEKIARKSVYASYSYIAGFEQNYSLGELAGKAIRKILENRPLQD